MRRAYANDGERGAARTGQVRRRMARAPAHGADGASVRAEFRAAVADMEAAWSIARRWAA